MENKIKQVFDKETSYRNLEIVNSWIELADNKSSILIAFVGLIVGLTANTYGKVINQITNGSDTEVILIIICGLMYLSILGLVIYHLISVFIARTKSKDLFQENLVSFISISNMSSENYINKSKTIKEEKLCEMILSQININAKIAKIKMKHFNYALYFGIILIPLTIILMVLVG